MVKDHTLPKRVERPMGRDKVLLAVSHRASFRMVHFTGPDSIHTWKQLDEQFHIQYHSEAAEAGIADLAHVRQKQGESVAEYIQRFREVKNRCYSTCITENEAIELASLGLA
jgi:hypothetical protein